MSLSLSQYDPKRIVWTVPDFRSLPQVIAHDMVSEKYSRASWVMISCRSWQYPVVMRLLGERQVFSRVFISVALV